ncbi:hypothetical protein [Candidatus Nanohalococcus occultus]|uniref:hypothetical protein n=1 Tax=Candidatus Nanohalococcus occultus TaxID=2978047 RepID=UPI0039E0D154
MFFWIKPWFARQCLTCVRPLAYRQGNQRTVTKFGLSQVFYEKFQSIIMSWLERLQKVVSQENQEGELEEKIDGQINNLKSRLNRGENPVDETREVLSEEEQLERELLDLEQELLDLLTFDEVELENVLESSKDFLEWKVKSLKEIEACLEPLKEIEQGLNSILNSVENPGKSPNIDLYQVGWQEVVEGSEQTFEIFDELKQEEQEIFEEFNQRQEDSARFLEKLDEERQAISKMQSLVQHLKSEQGELEGLETIWQSNELKQKLGEEEEGLSTLMSNLERLEEIDEKLDSVVQKRKEMAEKANERDLSELKKLCQFINNEYENIISRLEKLEDMNKKNYFTHKEELEQQINLVRESVEMVEEYINERYNLEVSRGVSRRGLLKGLGAALGGWTGLDTAINVYRQVSAGQFEFMNPKAIGGYDPAIENSLNGKPTDVHIFNVYFREGNQKYNGQKVAREVEGSINSLKGVQFRIHWHNLRPGVETFLERREYSRSEIPEDNLKAIEQGAERFRQLVNDTTVGADDVDGLKIDSTDRIDEVEEYLNDYFPNSFMEVFGYGTVKVIAADFKMADFSGISFGGSFKDDVVFAARMDDQTWFTNLLIHELGHKLSLPHTVSPDIMSYSVTSQALQKHFKVPFGPESQANWDKVRKMYREG